MSVVPMLRNERCKSSFRCLERTLKRTVPRLTIDLVVLLVHLRGDWRCGEDDKETKMKEEIQRGV